MRKGIRVDDGFVWLDCYIVVVFYYLGSGIDINWINFSVCVCEV